MKKITDRLIVALDVETLTEAERMVELLLPDVKIFKVGAQLFTATGPQIIFAIQEKGGRVFLDLKYHDIPHTVARAVETATAYGVHMLTLHAQGGVKMMHEALRIAEAKAKQNHAGRPILLGVTVLTSMEQGDFVQLGIGRSVENQVLHLTRLVLRAGLDGVVSSPAEAKMIRQNFGQKPLIVTPGIRLARIVSDDQKRISTPEEAICAGADYIVVGRPIIAAKEPLKEAERIKESICHSLKERGQDD
jgi:orotidine-5'-phosphate decarboxylase